MKSSTIRVIHTIMLQPPDEAQLDGLKTRQHAALRRVAVPAGRSYALSGAGACAVLSATYWD